MAGLTWKRMDARSDDDFVVTPDERLDWFRGCWASGRLGSAPMPLIPRRNTVDALDRLRVGADRERRSRTHHGQRSPVDVIDRVLRCPIVRIERHPPPSTPKPSLHFGFPL